MTRCRTVIAFSESILKLLDCELVPRLYWDLLHFSKDFMIDLMVMCRVV